MAVRVRPAARGWGAGDVVQAVLDGCLRQGCDGLFLGAVGHLGVRLPVAKIVAAVEAAREMRFVAVDGAQEFCHVPVDLAAGYCDLYLAGCHKWLGGFHPMGFGVYGRRRSRGVIDTAVRDRLAAGDLDDPLLRLSEDLERGLPGGEGETVNLAAVFSALGAAADAALRSAGGTRQSNADGVESIVRSAGWTTLDVNPELRTGIMLLRPSRPAARVSTGQQLRERFADHGVAVTAYDAGLVRVSLPDAPWEEEQLTLLSEVLQSSV